ncbi:hypothetical protein B7494_g1090 [Chlorociboria aeruginascens]|nr:hypothetical protein B7494_g1090 [Chlorociboria aeruginascens]
MASQTSTAIAPVEERPRRGSKFSIRGFIEDPETRKADSQLTQFVEGAIQEEKEMQLKGRFAHFYDDDEFDPIPDSPDIEEQFKLLNEQYAEFLKHLESEDGDGGEADPEPEGERSIEKKKWGKLNVLHRGSKKEQSTSIVTKAPRKLSQTPEIDHQGPSRPTIEDVKNAVLQAQEKWKSKPRMFNGKAQKYFHKFCGALSNHETLLEMIPDDKYFSIFCGGIKTLIRAAENHCKIAEELAESLSTISSNIDLCAETLEIWPLTDIKRMVGELYSYIFHFLRCAMKWFQSKSYKKVLDGLNENFLGAFESTLSSIESLKSMIYRKTVLKSQAELKDMHSLLREHHKAVKESQAQIKGLHILIKESAMLQQGQGLEAQNLLQQQNHKFLEAASEARDIHSLLRENVQLQKQAQLADRQRWYSVDKNFKEPFLVLAREIGTNVGKVLESNYQAATHPGGYGMVRRPTLSENVTQKKSKRSKQSLLTKKSYTRAKLQEWSKNLENYTTNTIDLIDTTNTSADNQVAAALEDWSRAMNSRTLWIRGYDEFVYPSSTSRISATVATRALQVGVPLLAFFCDCRDANEDPDEGIFLTREQRNAVKEAVIISFAYSLIRQAIALLPNKVETRTKFSRSGFAKLDGTLTTWDSALHILRKLLKLAPQAVLVVVDGIEQLDKSELGEYVDEILALLLGHADEEKVNNTRIFKVLVTTAGNCSALEKLDDVDMVSPSPVRAKRVHGRGRRDMLEHQPFETLTKDDPILDLIRQFTKKWDVSDTAVENRIELACENTRFPIVVLQNFSRGHDALDFRRMVDVCSTLAWIRKSLAYMGSTMDDVIILDAYPFLSDRKINHIGNTKSDKVHAAFQLTSDILRATKPNVIISCQDATSFDKWNMKYHPLAVQLASSISSAKYGSTFETLVGDQDIDIVQALQPQYFKRQVLSSHSGRISSREILRRCYLPCLDWKEWLE